MYKKLSLLLGLTALLSLSQKADAAGFALIEQSVSEMGSAYAGGAAIAEDASTIFFNPAGITRLCGNQVVAGGHGVFPYAKFDNHGSILFPGVNAGPVKPLNASRTSLRGNDGGNAGENALVGNLYWASQLNHCWHVGLAVNGPFGLSTDYDHEWKGRYHALHSYLLTVDINPVVAYRLNRCWSFGGGFRAVYAHAKLTNAVDYGTIAWLASLSTPDPAAVETGLNALGFLPQTQDGHVQLKGNAWGYGGNFGILYEPWCGTRFGVNWRSQVRLHITGKEKFSDLPFFIRHPTDAPDGLAAFFSAIKASGAIDTAAKTHITLPDIIQFSGYHQLNSCWAIMGDVMWTHWKLLKRLVFHFNNPNQADAVTTLKWRDAWRYAVGVNYTPNCQWIFRGGLAWDQTPVKNKEVRTPRIPDQSRFWTNVGFGYQWTRCLHIDVAYAHLFVRKPKIDKADFELSEDYIRGGLRGDYNAHTDIVSAQLVWNF